jgi:hypothetical protein
MAGFGCLMRPLDVLRPSVCTYIQTGPVCTYVQSRDYGQLFSDFTEKTSAKYKIHQSTIPDKPAELEH